MPYTLILTEKPSAARKIAYALTDKAPKKLGKEVTYYKIQRAGKDILIVPAVGHLFVLETKNNKNWAYPIFEVEWKATYMQKGNYWAKKYFYNIKKLAAGASEFISATDYDLEGSVIAYNVFRFICGVKDGKRMKFSTLTKPDLVFAYENASEHLDFGQIEAGLTRHYLDFYWGINLTRAMTMALRNAGGFQTISSGRVQSPTLNILANRQKEIEKFKPTPYWELLLKGRINEGKIEAVHEKGKFWEKEEVQGIFEKCIGKDGKVKAIKRKKYRQKPPFPFDLTTLQREAYRIFRFSPKQTLDIAQSLYEMALISYPRTSSQRLPQKIGYKTIIQNLQKQKDYSALCRELLSKPKLWPVQGKKTDPAHPAIFPTGLQPKALNRYQKKLYDLIVKRFLVVFGEPAVRETITARIDVSAEIFVVEGVRTIEKNWMMFYEPYLYFKEKLLPAMKEGDVLKVEKLDILDKETQPPKRYTQATILKEMERLGLGTKGTRAQILQTLYDRGYIKDSAIAVTELGQCVISALEKYCPEIISAEMTRMFERDMEDVQNGKKKRQDVVSEAKETLLKILKHFKENEKNIGIELLGGLRETLKKQFVIGSCKCNGKLVIKFAKGGKRFVACDQYPKCTETFSLPYQGKINILSQKCKCGLHIVSVERYKKRSWKLCVKCGFVKK